MSTISYIGYCSTVDPDGRVSWFVVKSVLDIHFTSSNGTTNADPKQKCASDGVWMLRPFVLEKHGGSSQKFSSFYQQIKFFD